jgi:hypothetical protein
LPFAVSKMALSKERSPCWALQQSSLSCLSDWKRADGSDAAQACDEQVREYKRCLKEQQALKTAKRNDAFFGRAPPETEPDAPAATSATKK